MMWRKWLLLKRTEGGTEAIGAASTKWGIVKQALSYREHNPEAKLTISKEEWGALSEPSSLGALILVVAYLGWVIPLISAIVLGIVKFLPFSKALAPILEEVSAFAFVAWIACAVIALVGGGWFAMLNSVAELIKESKNANQSLVFYCDGDDRTPLLRNVPGAFRIGFFLSSLGAACFGLLADRYVNVDSVEQLFLWASIVLFSTFLLIFLMSRSKLL